MFAPKPTKGQLEAAIKVLRDKIWQTWPQYNYIYQQQQTLPTTQYPQQYFQSYIGNNTTAGTYTIPTTYPTYTITAGGTGGIGGIPYTSLTIEELAKEVLEAAAQAWWEGVARHEAEDEQHAEPNGSTD